MRDVDARMSNSIEMAPSKRFATLNPVVGCPIGCRFCYARRIAERHAMTEDFSVPRFFPHRLRALSKRKGTVFFLDSMSDVAFWEREWLDEVMSVVRDNPQHEYMLLTKRPDRLAGTDAMAGMRWLWLGTTVTCDEDAWRLDALREISVGHRIVSFEPLLGDVGQLGLDGIEWAMIGEETGPEAHLHPVDPGWVEGIVRQADAAGIPVSVKEPLALRRGMPERSEMPEEMAALVRGDVRPGFPSFEDLLSKG